MDKRTMTMWEHVLHRTNWYKDYEVFNFFGKGINKETFVKSVENVANWFLGQGYKSGDCFAIFMPNTPHSIICFYALNKIGVIANMVHPATPPGSLIDILDKTKSKGILILDMMLKPYRELLEKWEGEVLCASMSQYMPFILKLILKSKEKKACGEVKFKNFMELVNYSQKHDQPKTDEDGTAVYINSSGTTDTPKTVMLGNAALNNFDIENKFLYEGIDYTRKDYVLLIAPLFHSGGLTSIHNYMCEGLPLILLPSPTLKSMCRHLNKDNIALLQGNVGLLKKIVKEKSFKEKSFKGLKSYGVGGGDVDLEFLDEFEKMVGRNGSKAQSIENYGLTENSALGAMNIKRLRDCYKRGSLGKPFPGTTIEIWNDNNTPLKPKEIGEIVVTGNTLMQGYLGVPGGGFVLKDGKKWVRTGDMGYLDEEGFLFFMTRKKRMVKISGYNVYLQEIERICNELDVLKECCAIESATKSGKPFVRLFVVLEEKTDDEKETSDMIRKFLEMRLERHSIPREIVFLENLPYSMGKVDYRALMNEEKYSVEV